MKTGQIAQIYSVLTSVQKYDNSHKPTTSCRQRKQQSSLIANKMGKQISKHK